MTYGAETWSTEAFGIGTMPVWIIYLHEMNNGHIQGEM